MTTATAAEMLTLKELGARLRVHPDTLRGMYRRGKIPGLKLGHRTLRFDFGEVVEALRRQGDPAVE